MFTPLSRIFEVTQCRTQAELAHVLGIRQSSISEAKKRKSIPAEWLITLLREKGTNPEWILSGQGSRLLVPLPHHEKAVHFAHNTLTGIPTRELAEELVRRADVAPAR